MMSQSLNRITETNLKLKTHSPCVICLENTADIKTLECNHCLLCYECYLKMNISNNQFGGICYICQKENVNLITQGVIISDITKIQSNRINQILFDSLRDMTRSEYLIKLFIHKNQIKFVNTNEFDKLCDIVKKTKNYVDQYHIIMKFIHNGLFFNKTNIHMLSVGQSTKLGHIVLNSNIYSEITKNYKTDMYKLLVLICIEPWKLSTDIFHHGICYHGNFNDEPVLYEHLYNYLNHNYLSMCI
jgi:hypothetical protein